MVINEDLFDLGRQGTLKTLQGYKFYFSLSRYIITALGNKPSYSSVFDDAGT